MTDSGVGIPAELREGVFEMFAQADRSIGERFGGTGIRLALCKDFVERMGGWIWVESEVGTGSSFQFTIVLPTVAEPVASASVSGSVSLEPRLRFAGDA